MRLGVPNRIDVIESSLKSEFDVKLSDSNDLIESTISIFDYIRSKIDLFSIKSTDFDTKLIKRSILIDLLLINQSKMVDLY